MSLSFVFESKADFIEEVEVGSLPSTIPIYKGKHALIIGASKYNSGWSPLPGVKTDRTSIERTLKRHDFNVVTLNDPTKTEIQVAFEKFISDYGREKDNLLIIFYSGHGHTLKLNDNRQQGYIVPVDAPLSEFNIDDFKNKALNINYFELKALEIESKHVLFLFDSCFSGSIFNGMRGSSSVSAHIYDLANKPIRLFISSGSANQTVPDISIFRHYFESGINGLSDLNKDGFVTGTELGLYLRSKVSNESMGKQTPLFAKMLRHNFHQGDIIFESPKGEIVASQSKTTKTSITRNLKETNLKNKTLFSLNSNSQFKDCRICPEMSTIPPGNFLMGSPEGDSLRNHDELTLLEVELNKEYAISILEISYENWMHCFVEGWCNWKSIPQGSSNDLPVNQVSWDEANQYTVWLSNKTNSTYRLPTEKEWEYAAKSGVTTTRPWGNLLGEKKANCRDCKTDLLTEKPQPVGSYKPNNFNLYDVLGNVWEWVWNCYTPSPESSLTDYQVSSQKCSNRVIRGGSFASSEVAIRLGARAFYPEEKKSQTIGFRVLKEL